MAFCIPYTYAAIAAEYRFRFSFLSFKSKTILYEIVLLNFLIYNLDQIKCYLEYSKFYIVCKRIIVPTEQYMNFGFKLQSSGRSESFETHLTEKKTPLKDIIQLARHAMIRLVSKHNRHNSCVRRNHFKDGVRSDSRVRDGISTEIFPQKKRYL